MASASVDRRAQDMKNAATPGGLAITALAGAICALIWYSRDDGSLANLRVLTDGLLATLLGPAKAASALPLSPPNMEKDWPIFRIFTFFFFAFNWGLRLLVVGPLVRSLKLTHDVTKFSQSVMEFIFYGCFTIFGLCIVPSQEWIWPSSQWWKGFADGGHENMRSDLQCYYIMYVARYTQALISVLIEPRRKDFWEMIIHHITTIVIIYISYVYGWNRVGVVVMALLDPGDVPLHLAKLCKYIAVAGGRPMWQFMADRFFEVFGLVFFITRIVMYGYVCWSAHIESSRYFAHGLPEWICLGLLYTLLVLQFYWFYLVLKVALKLLQGKGAEDVRSDDEDEEPTDQKKKD